MTPKERAAIQHALEAIGNTVNQALATIREALADPQITTPDVCGEVCARAKLCYGCNKNLEEANAKYAEQAEQEPVAYLHQWSEYHPFGDTVVGEPMQNVTRDSTPFDESDTVTPLYAAPTRTKDPCHPLQDLTDDDKAEIECALNMAFDLLCKPVDSIAEMYCFGIGDCDKVRQQLKDARAVIAAYKEKNK